MRTTYIASSNTATNGQSLAPDNNGSDVLIKKILIGAPVSVGNVIVYNIFNPVNAATTNIAAKITLPTFSTTNINPGMYLVDFTSETCQGLQLSGGGNVTIDQTMQVTVIWDFVDSES